MSLETAFTLASQVALVGWLLLALAPERMRIGEIIVAGIAILLAMLYSALLGVHINGATGGFGSLAAVTQLFSHPGVLLAGWVHYLAFDLLIGLWERGEAIRLRIPRWLLLPFLLLTLMYGPFGWLAFMALRAWWQARSPVPSAGGQT